MAGSREVNLVNHGEVDTSDLYIQRMYIYLYLYLFIYIYVPHRIVYIISYTHRIIYTIICQPGKYRLNHNVDNQRTCSK